MLGSGAGEGGSQDVAQRLQQLEEEKSHLQMRVEEAEAGTNAVYTELEGVSKLWEGVEHTLRTKVFELKDAELKMSRLITEVRSPSRLGTELTRPESQGG